MELVEPRQMVGDMVHFGGENGKFTFFAIQDLYFFLDAERQAAFTQNTRDALIRNLW